jgi:hypothetical protein
MIGADSQALFENLMTTGGVGGETLRAGRLFLTNKRLVFCSLDDQKSLGLSSRMSRELYTVKAGMGMIRFGVIVCNYLCFLLTPVCQILSCSEYYPIDIKAVKTVRLIAKNEASSTLGVFLGAAKDNCCCLACCCTSPARPWIKGSDARLECVYRNPLLDLIAT